MNTSRPEEGLVRANELFERLGSIVEAQVAEGVLELDVIKVAEEAGLEIDPAVLNELRIDPIIICPRFLPWHCWFPWRPLWCHWWRRHYPRHRCCYRWWCGCCHYHGRVF